jgi:hypothetical protein
MMKSIVNVIFKKERKGNYTECEFGAPRRLNETPNCVLINMDHTPKFCPKFHTITRTRYK